MQSNKGFSLTQPPLDGSSSGLKLPTIDCLSQVFTLGLSNFKSEEYRNLESMIQQFGKLKLQILTKSTNSKINTDVLIVPNRHINRNYSTNDSLIDAEFLENHSSYRYRLFLGKSGLFNLEPTFTQHDIRGVKTHKKTSATGKKAKRAEIFLTDIGRAFLKVPDFVKDKIIINVDDCLFPRIGLLPKNETPLATLKIDGLEYVAATYNEYTGDFKHFGNPSELSNLEEGFVYKTTQIKRGDLLLYFIMSKILEL